MILIRLAICLFAFALLGMAISLSSANTPSEQQASKFVQISLR